MLNPTVFIVIAVVGVFISLALLLQWLEVSAAVSAQKKHSLMGMADGGDVRLMSPHTVYRISRLGKSTIHSSKNSVCLDLSASVFLEDRGKLSISQSLHRQCKCVITYLASILSRSTKNGHIHTMLLSNGSISLL